jgi:hypothetical protein
MERMAHRAGRVAHPDGCLMGALPGAGRIVRPPEHVSGGREPLQVLHVERSGGVCHGEVLEGVGPGLGGVGPAPSFERLGAARSWIHRRHSTLADTGHPRPGLDIDVIAISAT